MKLGLFLKDRSGYNSRISEENMQWVFQPCVDVRYQHEKRASGKKLLDRWRNRKREDFL